MRFLLVDYHAGCLGAVGSTLISLGHSVSILPLTGHAHLLQDTGVSPYICSPELAKQVEHRLGLSAASHPKQAVTSNGADQGEPLFDVAWVSFPPAMYRRVLSSGLARHVVCYSAHRLDMWLEDPDQRERFFAEVRQDIDATRMTLVASNTFDQRYAETYVDRDVPLLEPVFPYLAEARDATLQVQHFEPPLIGPAHLDARSRRIRAIRRKLSSSSEHLEMKTIREAYKHYDYSDLIQRAGIVLLPYSIFSIFTSEVAALGVPTLVPTDSWLSREGLLSDVQLHPTYGARRRIERYKGPLRGPDPNRGRLSAEWLAAASWHGFPNTYLWDSAESLLDVVQQLQDVDRLDAVHRAETWEARKLEGWLTTLGQLETVAS